MPGFSIRPCTVDDAAMIASLGARLFAESYGPTHPEPELSSYLARSFSLGVIREAIADDGVTVLVVEDPAKGAIAYAYLRSSADPPLGVAGDRALEIVRFYVDGSASFYFGEQVGDDHVMSKLSHRLK